MAISIDTGDVLVDGTVNAAAGPNDRMTTLEASIEDALSWLTEITDGVNVKTTSVAAGAVKIVQEYEWDPSDGTNLTDDASGIGINFKMPKDDDTQAIYAQIAAIVKNDAADAWGGELRFSVADDVDGSLDEVMTLDIAALVVTPAITATGGVLGAVDGVLGGNTPAAATVTTFTSTGIDDNATGEILQITDTGATVVGDLSATDLDGIVGSNTAAAGTFTTLDATGAFTSLGIDDNATSTAITIDATENIGIGAAPTDFYATFTGVNIGYTGIFQCHTADQAAADMVLAQNVRQEITTADWTYIATASDEASYYSQTNGIHRWYTAVAGTAGNTATMNSRMILSEPGVLNLPQLTASTDVTTDGNKNLVTASDESWKNDEGNIKDALSIIGKLTPKYFRWKKDANGDLDQDTKLRDKWNAEDIAAQPRLAGFFAQNVYAAFPEGTPGGANLDGGGIEHWGLNSRAIIALNTRGIQELEARLEVLEAA